MFGRRLLAPLALTAALFAGACEDDDDVTGPQQEQFTATLTGQAERPNPVTTTATGTAAFTVTGGNTINYTINVNNLAGVTGAHIHGPAGTEANAGVLATLHSTVIAGTTNGLLAQGSLTAGSAQLATGITVDSLVTLMRNGNAYVNVHTSANKPGEIRGQIRRQ